jgi:tetratricopeptide (TPR) repeat protein
MLRPMMLRSAVAAILLTLACTGLRAGEPSTLQPAAGLNAAQAAQRALLFAELAAAKNEADARDVEDRIRKFWRSLADSQSQQLLEDARQSELRFDYDEATIYLKGVVKHQPQLADGWNELAYVYFLAGKYDASLNTIDKVLELEPLHYAALAGEGIILVQQGKLSEAQGPLKRALAIDPWLKERNLIEKDKDSDPEP